MHPLGFCILSTNYSQNKKDTKWCPFCFGTAYKGFHTSHKCLCLRIGFANLTQGRSVLAQELLGKFSSRSEPSRLFFESAKSTPFYCCNPYASDNPSPKRFRFGIGFANLTIERSVLVQELLSKFIAKSFCS